MISLIITHVKLILPGSSDVVVLSCDIPSTGAKITGIWSIVFIWRRLSEAVIDSYFPSLSSLITFTWHDFIVSRAALWLSSDKPAQQEASTVIIVSGNCAFRMSAVETTQISVHSPHISISS